MDDRTPELVPSTPEAPGLLEEEPGSESRTPAAPRPTFTREYPVFGYE